MAEQVRVGIIGCGAISKRHVEWLLAKKACSIAFLCDVDEGNLAEREAQVRQIRPAEQPRLVKDYRHLLDSPEIDGVLVLLPHSLHYRVAADGLDAGKHVLVEKPMTISATEAEELVRRRERSGRLLAVGYQRAYMSEYLLVKRMIREGQLGTVRFLSAHLEQSWYRYATGDNNLRAWKTDPAHAGGGQLVDTGSHTIAAALHVSNLAPIEVYAIVDRCGLQVDVNTSLSVRFAGGAIGSIMIGGFGDRVTEVLRVVGDRRSARIFFRTVKEQSLEVDGEIVDAKAIVPGSNPDENFVDAISGRAEIEAGGELGLDVARISEAAYASADSDRPVRIQPHEGAPARSEVSSA